MTLLATLIVVASSIASATPTPGPSVEYTVVDADDVAARLAARVGGKTLLGPTATTIVVENRTDFDRDGTLDALARTGSSPGGTGATT